MKNNLLLISVMLFLTCQISNSQNYYYYYNGSKVFLELDTSVVNLITENNFSNSATNNVGFKNYSLQQDNNLVSNKFGKAEHSSEPSSIVFHQKLNLLKSIPTIKSIGLYFKKSDTSSIGTSNYFYVKLKNENDLSILQQYCIQKGVQIVKQVLI
jgi:hypothetical protein